MEDFILSCDQVTLTSNISEVCIQLTVLDDSLLEFDEQFTLFLTASNEDSAVIVIAAGQNQTVLTLENDDSELWDALEGRSYELLWYTINPMCVMCRHRDWLQLLCIHNWGREWSCYCVCATAGWVITTTSQSHLCDKIRRRYV
jgi:hypothetical protein